MLDSLSIVLSIIEIEYLDIINTTSISYKPSIDKTSIFILNEIKLLGELNTINSLDEDTYY